MAENDGWFHSSWWGVALFYELSPLSFENLARGGIIRGYRFAFQEPSPADYTPFVTIFIMHN
jgi:hypothetical protein